MERKAITKVHSVVVMDSDSNPLEPRRPQPSAAHSNDFSWMSFLFSLPYRVSASASL